MVLINLMDFLIIFLLSSSFLLVNTESCTCCDDDGSINISLGTSSASASCGVVSGFEISCKQNKSFIHFVSYGDLEVKSISYEEKSLNLIDSKNCVHQVFLNLNLTGTPFTYYHVLKKYTYLNCSVQLPMSSFTQVPCLSNTTANHHVYIVEPSFLSILPADSCTPIKTIGIPFSYSPYISDNSFGLRLSWDHSDDDHDVHVTTGNHCWIDIVYYKVLGLAMFIFMVITLGFLKTSYLDEEINDQELKKKDSIQGQQTLLGDSDTV